MSKKLTTEEFIQKAILVHGDRYDYSKVIYLGTHKKVRIICPDHGEFWQDANSHLQNHGCPNCGGTNQSNTKLFIVKSKNIHGDIYDYSLVEYKNNKTKVKIICKEHGIFEQQPDCHIHQQQGCPKCDKTMKDDLYSFITKSKNIHNNRYDYSKVEYKGSNSKVCIICPEHGEFWQIPQNHIRGCGCSLCHSSKAEQEIEILLNKHNMRFIPQKRFSDCRNIKPLPFDFYLPDYNTCIEYDGELHFNTLRIKDKEKALYKLNKTQIHDKIKNEYCQQNNIRLIRISYLDFKNINQILSKQLFR